MQCVVWWKDDFFFAQAALDARVDVVRESEVVADTDNADLRLVEFGVDARQVVDELIPGFFDEVVDLVEYEHDELFL